MNNPVITPKNIFWGTWWSVWHSLSSQHGHSRKTKIQDRPNINADKTKIHGSIHRGMYSAWATSGAKSPTIPNTTGNTQQKMCGKTVAMIPNFTILFFILNPSYGTCATKHQRCDRGPAKFEKFCGQTWYPQQESNLHQRFRKPPFYPVELWGRTQIF